MKSEPLPLSVPLAYRRHLQAALALALDEVVRDMLARVEGREPIIPDFLVDLELRGTSTVTVDENDMPSAAVMREGVELSARQPGVLPMRRFIKRRAVS